MGTVGNQNPWAPYDSYRDCSQGICSAYCQQWCYLFPPPPPLELEDDSDTTFSPLIIAIISILASAFLLVTYYTIITKYCRRRRLFRSLNTQSEATPDQITHDQLQTAVTGLDETLIKSITVFKYIKGDGLIEGTECAVCLNEFRENESLRLLPKCTHAFHLPCIDTWLKTHSNCPLCRSNAAPTFPAPPPPPPPAPGTQTSSTVNASSLEIRRQNDLILVVEDCERSRRRDEVVVSLVGDCPPKDNIHDHGAMQNAGMRTNEPGNDEARLQHSRRSMSLDTFSSEGIVSVADILEIDEDEPQSRGGIGSSRDYPGEQSKPGIAMKRSISTGRFVVTHDKGKNSIGSS